MHGFKNGWFAAPDTRRLEEQRRRIRLADGSARGGKGSDREWGEGGGGGGGGGARTRRAWNANVAREMRHR